MRFGAPVPAVAAALAAAVAVGACAGARLSRDASVYGAPTAEAAVRGFLDAASRGAYPRMGRLFGTRRGPAESRLGVADVERRMVVVAGLLDLEAGPVPLLPSPLTEPDPARRRFRAAVDRPSGTGTVGLPVVAVRAGDGRWFVERLELAPAGARSP